MGLGLRQLKIDFKNGKIPKADYIKQMHILHESLFEYANFINDTSISQVIINQGQVIMTCKPAGIQMVCNPQDERIAPVEILNFGAYEPDEFNMVLKLVKKGGIMLDVGANIGWYAMSIARMVTGVTVHAFEPVPRSFNALKQNLALNNILNVKAYPYGLSNKNGQLVFYFAPAGSTNASAVNLSGERRVQKVKAKVKTMDSVMAKISSLDFIKCDVEGAELLVFQGGLKSLQIHRPIIFTEMLRKWSAPFGYHPNDIISLLSGIGYGCFSISGKNLKPFKIMTDATKETNFFFLHPKKHASQINRLVKK